MHAAVVPWVQESPSRALFWSDAGFVLAVTWYGFGLCWCSCHQQYMEQQGALGAS